MNIGINAAASENTGGGPFQAQLTATRRLRLGLRHHRPYWSCGDERDDYKRAVASLFERAAIISAQGRPEDFTNKGDDMAWVHGLSQIDKKDFIAL